MKKPVKAQAKAHLQGAVRPASKLRERHPPHLLPDRQVVLIRPQQAVVEGAEAGLLFEDKRAHDHQLLQPAQPGEGLISP